MIIADILVVNYFQWQKDMFDFILMLFMQDDSQ